MKNLLLFFSLLILLFLTPASAQSIVKGYQYVSPVPNSKMNSRATNIIIRQGDRINPSSLLNKELLNVEGSKSGRIKGSLQLSDDDKTILFQAEQKFTEGETITVNYKKGIFTAEGMELPPLNFSFVITALKEPLVMNEEIQKLFTNEVDRELPLIKAQSARPALLKASPDSLPSDFPAITIDTVNNPAPGYLFMSISADVPGIGFYNFILNPQGKVVKYIKLDHHYTTAFRVQPNGKITFAELFNSYLYAGGGQCIHRVLDTALNVIDSFQCGNGYLADGHDFQILPNGHALIVAYDLQPVDMSQLVTGGNPGALVYGSIVQELDLQKRVIFQWRSWDAIPITDSYNNITAAGFDYIHVNSIKMDYDGNIMLGSRLLCELTKLNRTTGEVMWRMGGKKNQFTFINEHAQNAPTYFSHPHSVEILPNRHILLFDNGLLHSPQYSRAVEYEIDESSKTATMVWEYRHTPDLYAATQGSVQRLPNGGTLIGWGSTGLTGLTAVTEIAADNSTIFEMRLPRGCVSYRVGKYPYKDYKPAADISIQDVITGTQYIFNQNNQSTGTGIYFNQLVSGYNIVGVKKHLTAPVNPVYSGHDPQLLPFRTVIWGNGISAMNADVSFDSTYFSGYINPQLITVYSRSNENQGTFTPLLTAYNESTNQLTVTSTRFGEFVFGIIRTISLPGAPLPYAPAMNAKVDQTNAVNLGFSSVGITTGYHLIIATDSLFAGTIVNDSSRVSGVYTLAQPAPNTTYYYKVRGKNELGWGPWSTVRVFSTSAPAIAITVPKGGENWVKKKQYFIQWYSNVSSTVRIELLRNHSVYSVIEDTAANSFGFAWKLPDTLAVDSVYTIRITSNDNGLVLGESPAYFRISAPSGIDEIALDRNFDLSQNFPNPFNPATTISYTVPAECNVRLTVYNSIGQETAILVNRKQTAGTYDILFNAEAYGSGVYFYKLQAGGLVKIRKMILLK